MPESISSIPGNPRPPTPTRKRSNTYQPDGPSPHPPLPQRSTSMPVKTEKMTRNKAFHPDHVPLRHHPVLRLEAARVSGPVTFLNPTTAHFRSPHNAWEKQAPLESPSKEKEGTSIIPLTQRHEQPDSAVSYKWTSRNNRKGRHLLAVNPTVPPGQGKYVVPPVSSTLREIFHGILRMFTWFPIWDISYDVAAIFTFGSVIWCINAFFVWLPLVRPDTEFHNESLYGGGITAFIGATIFEIGSFLLMAEAVNENRTGCFGWAVERVLSHEAEKAGSTLRIRPDKDTCTHHHMNKLNLVGKGVHSDLVKDSAPGKFPGAKSWIWWPSKADLKNHYLHDLGFLASLSQLLGASIFWVSGLTALPGILNKMSRPVEIIFFWTPQIIGGSGFIISGTLFMIETQPKWYVPAPKTLGWHIGLWNLIGGVGFTLCPAFGYDTSSWAQYQSCLATFWGSWAFLIGSMIQWYESLSKNPVEVDKGLIDGNLDD